MKTRVEYGKLAVLTIAYFLGIVSILSAAPVVVIEPTSSFTARLIGSSNVLVGAPSGIEGTVWQTNIFEIKEDTSDRTILEYDLRGRPMDASAILNLELTNLDVPQFTSIFMYTFAGNGLANAADYFKTDSFVTKFTDNGLATNFVPPYHIPFSFDLTSAYNSAIVRGVAFLGVLLKNTIDEAQYARYRLTTFNGLPSLTVVVPEPGSICLVSAAVLLMGSLNSYRRRAALNR